MDGFIKRSKLIVQLQHRAFDRGGRVNAQPAGTQRAHHVKAAKLAEMDSSTAMSAARCKLAAARTCLLIVPDHPWLGLRTVHAT